MAYSAAVFPCPPRVELLEGLQAVAEGAAGCVWRGLVICALEMGRAWAGSRRDVRDLSQRVASLPNHQTACFQQQTF